MMASETLNSRLTMKTSSSPLDSSELVPVSSPPPAPHSDHPNRLRTAKSSKWLQRLRSSRGFPESDHIDLDHFLSTSPQTVDHTRIKPPLPHENLSLQNSDTVQGRDLINNVLSELFHMGDMPRFKSKKSCRKQQCPRICVVSTPLALSSRHKVKEVNQTEGDCDLSVYSQTEVTVIDTSVPCWKFEKMLYRSKNVWKVGDKKAKGLMIVERKKRNGGDVQKKKLKKKMKLCNSLNHVEAMDLSKSVQGRCQGKVVAANEKKRDSFSEVQEKSFCKKQIDEASSIILIKSIPTTNKKNVPGISNSSAKCM
ncbi:hypothetical protein R6Q59_021589 [Mikania micrantha]